MKVVEINNVNKTYGTLRAVDNVSIEVSKGEIFGLLGPNGAGKSTLISILTTILTPDSGKIIINGFNIQKQPNEVKKIIGMVPQEIALYPTLTAKENLLFWGKMYGIRGEILQERVEEALEIAGLKDRSKEKIESFSGGMKRRINISAALLHHPEILIMDEPTVGIDPQSRNHILETVLDLNKKGTTVIYTSHYMEEVEYLCSRIAIMDKGKVIATGSKEELRQLAGDVDVILIQTNNVCENTLSMIKQNEELENVELEGQLIRITTKSAEKVLAKIISILEAQKCRLNSIKIEQANLESAFLHLTGRALRD